MDLQAKLGQLSSQSRLNTVEAALAGTPGAQQNFSAQWAGYDKDGTARVKVNGQIYNANGIGRGSIPLNRNVVLRAGKGIMTVNW